MKIVAEPDHSSKRLGHLPFVLNVDAQSVFSGEAIKEVAGNGVVPVVHSIGQPIRRSKLKGVLGFNVVAIQCQRDIGICKVPVGKLKNSCQGRSGTDDAGLR